VSEISLADSQNVQSFPVEVSFDNKGFLIKPGMSGDAEITFSEKKNVLSIPLGAISKKDNKILVKVLENEITKEVEIKAGVATLEYLEVLSGLKEGDKVILENQN
jgi:multidrug efflux pump subunit AcrA (membrane-fusion protein)